MKYAIGDRIFKNLEEKAEFFRSILNKYDLGDFVSK